MQVASERAQRPSINSPLEAIPKPEDIRERIVRNSQEGRLLRSLYRLSRRIAEQSKQGEVVHAG